MKELKPTTVILSFVFSFLLNPLDAASADKLKVAYAAITGAMSVPWIAKETGIFAQNGLDVTLIYIGSGSKTAQAQVAGEIDIAHVAGPGVVSASLAGADLVMIAGSINQIIHDLVVSPQIRKVQELKGGRLGISRFGSTTDVAIRYILKKNGIDPDKDVSIIQLGGEPEILASLKAGTISGGMLNPPHNLIASRAGLKLLVEASDLNIPFQGSGVSTRKSFIRKNEDIVRRYVKAYVDALTFFRKNREASIAVMKKYIRTEDIELLNESYSLYAERYFARPPYPTLDGIQMILNVLAKQIPKAVTADPKEFVDMRFIKELEDGGYTRKLYEK